MAISPKRAALSLSRDGASLSLRDTVHTQGAKQGAKPTEVYGFVGAISTLVAFGTPHTFCLDVVVSISRCLHHHNTYLDDEHTLPHNVTPCSSPVQLARSEYLWSYNKAT